MAQRAKRLFGSRLVVAVTAVIVTTVVVSGGVSAFAQAVAELVPNNSVNSSSIVDHTVQGVDMANSTVGSNQIKDNGVHSADIRDGDVSGIDIAPNSIAGDDITDNSITASDIGGNSVGAAELGTLITVDATSASIAAGANGSATATCPAGSIIISGGNDASSFTTFVVAMRKAGNGWETFVHNTDGSAHTITTHAYCLQ